MFTCCVLFAYEDIEEDTFEFDRLRTFCGLFDFKVEQPEPICREKKRHCTVDEYPFYRWDEYTHDHFVRVTVTCNDPNLFYGHLALLERFAAQEGMLWSILSMNEVPNSAEEPLL